MDVKNPHDSGIALDMYFQSSEPVTSPGLESDGSSSSMSETSSESILSTPATSAVSSPRIEAQSDADLTADWASFQLPKRSTRTAKYASSVIRREAAALVALAERLCAQENECQELETAAALDFDQAVSILSSMPPHGKLLISGIGKSALLGRKAVATFCSLGIPALFLCPVAALHGDLGCISGTGQDVLLSISYSGKTQEVLNLLPLVKNRCSHLIALTGNGDSPLAKQSDVWLDGSISGDGLEADPQLPAPTSSVAVALGLLHALGLSVMRCKTGWDSHARDRQEVFAKHHPGGR